jgi:hypothetical protein
VVAHLNHRLVRFSFPSGKCFEFFGYNELGKVKEINNAANLPTRLLGQRNQAPYYLGQTVQVRLLMKALLQLLTI